MKPSGKSVRKIGRAASIGLTRDQIVQEAIALIDEQGSAGFSIRALARRLKVYPAALYFHIDGAKVDLIAQISAALIADLMQPEEMTQDWRETLRILFRRFRERMHQHPQIAPLMGPHIRSNGAPNAPWVEIILTALDQAGFEGPGLVDAFNAVLGALEGYITIELAKGSAAATPDWVTAFDQGLEALDPARFPLVTRYLPLMYNASFVMRWKNGAQAPLHAGYECLLDLLISGLESRAPRAQDRPAPP